MPIHQTKFTIANPQPTGMSTPQIPMPLTNRYAIDTISTLVSRKASRNPAHQPIGVLRVRTIELILSVTLLHVYPGGIPGGVPVPMTAALGFDDGVSRSSITSRTTKI